MIDSRAGRQVTPGRRELVQDEEWDWIREQACKPARHLLLASSVPFLLAPGLHHVEAFDEALTDGAWGRLGAVLGEKLRRIAVLDHWASFQRTFHKLAELLDDVAHGRAGEPPSSIVMLSGDVHHCYLAEVGFRAGTRSAQPRVAGRLLGLSQGARAARAARHRVRALGRRRAPRAPPRARPPAWRRCRSTGASSSGPAYANQIATLTLDGEHAHASRSRRSPTATGAIRGWSWRSRAT